MCDRLVAAQRLSDSKVSDQRRTFVQQNIFRLHVAMHHLMTVRIVERRRDFARDAQRIFQTELTFLIEPVTQRMPFHIGHHIVKQTFCFSGIEYRKYVIVRETRSHLDLTQKTLGSNLCRDFRAQDFYRDCALVTQVVCEVHDSHPTFTELPVHCVPA